MVRRLWAILWPWGEIRRLRHELNIEKQTSEYLRHEVYRLDPMFDGRIWVSIYESIPIKRYTRNHDL